MGEAEPGAPPPVSQFFWLWAPFNFPDTLVHFDVNEEEDGTRWHEIGFVLPVDAAAGTVAPASSARATIPPLNPCVPTDHGLPEVTSVSFSPTSVDVREGPAKVTVPEVAPVKSDSEAGLLPLPASVQLTVAVVAIAMFRPTVKVAAVEPLLPSLREAALAVM